MGMISSSGRSQGIDGLHRYSPCSRELAKRWIFARPSRVSSTLVVAGVMNSSSASE
ncbi:hypothetical protein D3C80_2155660 [compost metagenome]